MSYNEWQDRLLVESLEERLMGWNYLQWIAHLRVRHGYDGKFEYMLPGSVGGCVVQHDLDHNDEIGLGHVHPDAEDLDQMEEV